MLAILANSVHNMAWIWPTYTGYFCCLRSDVFKLVLPVLLSSALIVVIGLLIWLSWLRMIIDWFNSIWRNYLNIYILKIKTHWFKWLNIDTIHQDKTSTNKLIKCRGLWLKRARAPKENRSGSLQWWSSRATQVNSFLTTTKNR